MSFDELFTLFVLPVRSTLFLLQILSPSVFSLVRDNYFKREEFGPLEERKNKSVNDCSAEEQVGSSLPPVVCPGCSLK